MADESLVSPLHRDGTDLLGLLEAGRQTVLQKAEERVDSRKPRVAGASRAAPLGLDVLQERQDEWHVELFKGDLGWLDIEAACSDAYSGSSSADRNLYLSGAALNGTTPGTAAWQQAFYSEGTNHFSLVVPAS